MPPRSHARALRAPRLSLSPALSIAGARKRLALAEPAAALVERHLSLLFQAIGKEVFDQYIDDIVEVRLAALGNASKFALPRRRSQERIDFITQVVRESPPEGIRIPDLLTRLKKDLGTAISRQALQEFLRRYSAHHQLVTLSGHVRLQTEAVLELLAARHRAKLLEMKKEEGS